MSDIHIKGTRVIDLSQTIAPDIPVPPSFPPPELEIFFSQAQGHVSNVECLTLILHEGTHIDAPYHFFSELRRVDELRPDSLLGPAIVVDLTDKRGNVVIEAQDIKNWELCASETIQPDDIVLLHTGHARNWKPGKNASLYWENGWPHFARSAVDYLAAKPIKAIGVECFDPDWVDLNDLTTAEFTTHRTFLPKGILIIENLTNLDQIPMPRCFVIALPLKIKGASGSPARVVAIV
jgi:arylformamidase